MHTRLMARLEFQVIQSKRKDQWRFLLGEIKTNSPDSLSCKLERNGRSRNHNVLGVDVSTQRTTAMQVKISAHHWLHTLGSCALPTFYTVTTVSQSHGMPHSLSYLPFSNLLMDVGGCRSHREYCAQRPGCYQLEAVLWSSDLPSCLSFLSNQWHCACLLTAEYHKPK